MAESQSLCITRDELLQLSFDFLTIVESHHSICRWLGPYESDECKCDIAEFYRRYFEGKLSRLLISLAAHLRILDDRGLLSEELAAKSLKPDESSEPFRLYQNAVGTISFDGGEWKPLIRLRDLLNTIMHGSNTDFEVSRIESTIIDEESGFKRDIFGYNEITITSTPMNSKKGPGVKSVKINLTNFARYLFDIVEAYNPNNQKS